MRFYIAINAVFVLELPRIRSSFVNLSNDPSATKRQTGGTLL
jgi:hypothetical protein